MYSALNSRIRFNKIEMTTKSIYILASALLVLGGGALIVMSTQQPEASQEGGLGVADTGRDKAATKGNTYTKGMSHAEQDEERELEPSAFTITHDGGGYQWSDRDLMSEEAIATYLAKTPEMYERLCEENNWTVRRQLVYVQEEMSTRLEGLFKAQGTSQIDFPLMDGERVSLELNPENVEDLAHLSEEGAEMTIGSLTTQTADGWSVIAACFDDHWVLEMNHESGRKLMVDTRIKDEWVISEIDTHLHAHFHELDHEHDHVHSHGAHNTGRTQ